MRRRQRDYDGPNNDRWLVSYADFVTVLFGFFVFLYAISSAEQEQVRHLSDAVQGVFLGSPRTPDPVTIGEAIPEVPQRLESGNEPASITPARELHREMADVMDGSEEAEAVEIREGSDWLELKLPGGLILGKGDVSPGPEGVRILERVASVLSEGDTAIVVEGFSDNLPVRSARFPSNWELSAARAAAVVRVLESAGVASERLGAMGYGSNHPVARNDTERGRSMNRRIEVVISTGDSVPPGPAGR